MKYKRRAWAIEIKKRDGRELLQDKEGPIICMSKVKAVDSMRAARASGRFGDQAFPKVVPIILQIRKVEDHGEG